MRVYHGSNVTIEKPNPHFSKRTKMDFGRGFYTTSSLDQAERFTNIVLRKNQGVGEKTVNIYNFDVSALKKLKVKDFGENLDEWLDYVQLNRRKAKDMYIDYDIIIGPVADDAILTTFTLYEEGIINRNETLERLKLGVYTDQLVFKSEQSIEYLDFVKAVVAS